MNYFRSLERRGRGLESHSRHGYLYCVRLFCVCLVLYLGMGLVMGWSPVQRVLLTVYRTKKLEKRPKPNRGQYSLYTSNLNTQQINSSLICLQHAFPFRWCEGDSKQVTNGSKTAVMDVTGFLCVSLGSSTVQFHDSLSSKRACSEVSFSSQHGDRAWGVY
jgi:hypothetical protein